MQLNICQISRHKRRGANSIEEIFGQLYPHLLEKVSLQRKIVQPRCLVKDILRIRSSNADVYHITGDVNYVALFLNPSKTIVTVHDIGYYELNLKGIKKYVYGLIWFRWPLLRAKYVTAVSEFTKQKLIQHFNIPEAKIKVIGNPAPPFFKQRELSFKSKKPAILQIGYKTNKNLVTLIEAVKGLSCSLLLINKDAYLQIPLLKAYNIEYKILQDLTYEQVYNAYCSADIVYFASTYEGFGMPILEAQAIGRPVITSNMEPMRSVAGSGAYFVNPDDILEIRNGILEIVNNSNHRCKLISNGFENVKRYDIKLISDEYFKLYNITSSIKR